MDLLLVHGLGRTGGSMWRLGRDLRQAGHRPGYFTYFPWAEPYDRILTRLSARLERLRSGDAPYALVGHSLGGLLLRQALARTSGRAPELLVMLGTPNHSPRMARHAWRAGPFRWTARGCGRFLADPERVEQVPPPECPYLVIAGTRGVYGRWSPFGDEPNDGLVAVTEAELGGPEHLVTVPAAHTFIMNHPAVRQVIRDALAARAAQAA